MRNTGITKRDLWDLVRPLGLFPLFALPTMCVLWFLVRFKAGRFFSLGGVIALGYWAAFGVLLVLFARQAAERRRREKRRLMGLCVQCGYDLTGNVSGVCPECGRAL